MKSLSHQRMRTLLHFVFMFLFCASTAFASSTQNGTYVYVKMEKAGTLEKELVQYSSRTITSLKVSGSIDINDINTIRQLVGCYDKKGNKTEGVGIRHLNLRNAQLVGGSTTLTVWSAKDKNGKKSSKTAVIGQNNRLTGVFAYLEDLQTVVLPKQVTVVGSACFYGCKNLTSVSLPENLLSIRDSSFYDCSSLPVLILHKKVGNIMKGAFANCSGLTAIYAEMENATNFATGAFKNANNGNCVFKAVSYNVCNFARNEGFRNVETLNPNINDIVVDNNECGTLSSRIDCYWQSKVKSLTVSGEMNFNDIQFVRELVGCYSLAEDTVKEGALRHLDIRNVRLQSGAYSSPTGAQSAKYMEIDSDGNPMGIFAMLDSLQTVKLPDNITSIGNTVFTDCPSLTSVEIPSGVKSIGSLAFEGCQSLRSADLPQGLETIETRAFCRCASLPYLRIPSTVTMVGDMAFYGCTGLNYIYSQVSDVSVFKNNVFTDINYDNCQLYIPSDAYLGYGNSKEFSSFRNKYRFDSATGVVSDIVWLNIAKAGTLKEFIDDFLIYKIEAVDIDGDINCDDISVLRKMAGCYDIHATRYPGVMYNMNLEDARFVNGGMEVMADHPAASYRITITDDGVASAAFAFCGKLRKVTLPRTMKSVGSSMFEGCVSLRDVYMYPSLTRISDKAFGVTGITSLYLPKNLQSIGSDAFKSCSRLKRVSAQEIQRVPSMGSNVFNEIPSNCILYVRKGLSDSYRSNAEWKVFNQIKEIDPTTGKLDQQEVVNVEQEGTLQNLLRDTYLIADLKVNGRINISDINYLRSLAGGYYSWKYADMPYLQHIDLKDAVLVDDGNSVQVFRSGGYAKISDGGKSIARLFDDLTYIKSVVLPEGISTIGEATFKNCSGLEYIELPKSLTNVGDSALAGCSSLKYIKATMAIPPTAQSNSFAMAGVNGCKLYVPQGSAAAYRSATGWNVFRNVVEYDPATGLLTEPMEVTTGPTGGNLESMFDNFSRHAVASLKINNGVNILDIAFIRELAGCYGADGVKHDGNLRRLDLSDAWLTGVVTDKIDVYGKTTDDKATASIDNSGIPHAVFAYLYDMQEVKLPVGLSIIGESMFQDCSNLGTMTLSDIVSTVGSKAFSGCSSLKTFYAMAATPASVTADTFSGANTGECVLYVPRGSFLDYSSATGWREFKHIYETDITGVNGVSADSAVKEVARYAADGQRVNTPVKGLNIVKYSDGTTRKEIVK